MFFKPEYTEGRAAGTPNAEAGALRARRMLKRARCGHAKCGVVRTAKRAKCGVMRTAKHAKCGVVRTAKRAEC